MDADEQTTLVFDFMQAVAPEIARYHLRLLHQRLGAPYTVSEEVCAEARRETANANANVTLEFAMHLAGAFARCQASINEAHPAKTQETTAPDKPRKAKPIARIQPPAAGVLKGTSPMPDLPEHRD